MQSTSSIKKFDYSLVLLIVALVVVCCWLITISPVTASFALGSLQSLQAVLMVVSLIGLLLAIANLVVIVRQKRENILGVAAMLLFLVNLLAPAILFFLGFLFSGAR